jgi:hypothetical protein
LFCGRNTRTQVTLIIAAADNPELTALAATAIQHSQEAETINWEQRGPLVGNWEEGSTGKFQGGGANGVGRGKEKEKETILAASRPVLGNVGGLLGKFWRGEAKFRDLRNEYSQTISRKTK